MEDDEDIESDESSKRPRQCEETNNTHSSKEAGI